MNTLTVRLLRMLALVQMARVTIARWIDALWGYDVFIAHRRSDAAPYANAIYSRLTAERISAFIDKEVYGPGDSLLVATRRHVAKSTLFLLLGSPELLSVRKPIDWVEREIDTYLTSHAADPKLILIDFGGTVENALVFQNTASAGANPILRQLAPFLRIREDMPALLRAPSEEVLDAVRRNLKGRRRDRNRIRFFEGVAAILGVLLLGAVGLGLIAWQQKNLAIEETARARANEYATKARGLINSNSRAAVLAAVEAARQTTTGAVEPISQEVLSSAVSQFRGVPLPGDGEFRDELSWAQSIAISEDGRRVAVGDWNGSVFLWDITDRAKPRRLRALQPIYGASGQFSRNSPARLMNVGLSQDGQWIAIATRTQDDEKLLRITDTNNSQDINTPQIEQTKVYSEVEATSINNRFLLLSHDRSEIRVLDLNTQSGDLEPKLVFRSDSQLLAISATADGRSVASIDGLGRISICTIDNATLVKAITLPALVGLPSAWENQAAFKQAFKVSSLRLSPDGKYLALLAKLPSERRQAQQMAEIWDISQPTPAVVASYPSVESEFGSFDEGNGNLVTEIAFSPDSSFMALAHNDQLILWNLSQTTPAEPPSKVITLPAEYSAMVYSPASKWLAIGDSGGGVHTEALGSLESNPINSLNAEDGAGGINALIFSKSGDLLLAAGQGDAAWLLSPNGETANSGFLELAPPSLQQGEAVQVSDDGSIAAALTSGGLWLASVSDLKTRVLPLQKASDADTKQHLHFYANGRRAVVWDEVNPRIYVINLDSDVTHATVASIDYPSPVLTDLAFDANGQWVVANDNQRRAVLISLRDLGPGHEPKTLTDYEGGGLVFSPQSSWLLSGTGSATFEDPYAPHLWSLASNHIDHYLLPDIQSKNLDSYQFSQDDRWLAASEGYKPVQGESKVYVWTLAADIGPRSPALISAHSMKAGVRFSPDGEWMISFDDIPGAMDPGSSKYLPKKLCLWKIPQFEAPAWQRSFEVQSIEASFSPDSSWLTIGTDDTVTATLLDLHSKSLPETPDLNSGGTLAGDWNFSFSGDGRWFVTDGVNAAARLWKFDSAKHPSLVEQNLPAGSGHLAFSPKSQILAVSEPDITKAFWLSGGSDQLRNISLPTGGLPHFGADETRLVLRTPRAVKVVELDPDRIMSNLATPVGRNLTWTEWNRLFPGRPYVKTFPTLPADPSIAAQFLERAETAVSSNSRRQAADAYSAASDWAIDSGNPVAANDVAWSGATHGFAKAVLPAAEFAVGQAPANGYFRDTRGVARCMLADLQGALDDFQAYLEWSQKQSPSDPALAQRREWIATMKAGKIPNGSCNSGAG